jgi:hypothetical protein
MTPERQGRPTTTVSPLNGQPVSMTLAAIVIVVVGTAFTAAVVFGGFIWAAKKDGNEDRATQKRLGIRRRTRLGR